MKGIVVFGTNGSVVFHTAPCSRDFVDNCVAAVESALHTRAAFELDAVGAQGSSLTHAALPSLAFMSFSANRATAARHGDDSSSVVTGGGNTGASSSSAAAQQAHQDGVNNVQQQSRWIRKDHKRIVDGVIPLFPEEHCWASGGSGGGGNNSKDDMVISSGGKKVEVFSRKNTSSVSPSPSRNNRESGKNEERDSAQRESEEGGGNGKQDLPKKEDEAAAALVQPSKSAVFDNDNDEDEQEEEILVLYWRKVADKIMVFAIDQHENLALAKHCMSAFIVCLAEAFKSGSELPSLKEIACHPEWVQAVCNTVAPQHYLVTVDIPLAKQQLIKQLRGK